MPRRHHDAPRPSPVKNPRTENVRVHSTRGLPVPNARAQAVEGWPENRRRESRSTFECREGHARFVTPPSQGRARPNARDRRLRPSELGDGPAHERLAHGRDPHGKRPRERDAHGARARRLESVRRRMARRAQRIVRAIGPTPPVQLGFLHPSSPGPVTWRERALWIDTKRQHNVASPSRAIGGCGKAASNKKVMGAEGGERRDREGESGGDDFSAVCGEAMRRRERAKGGSHP